MYQVPAKAVPAKTFGVKPILNANYSSSMFEQGMKPPIQIGGEFNGGGLGLSLAGANYNPYRKTLLDPKQMRYDLNAKYDVDPRLSLALQGMYQPNEYGADSGKLTGSLNYKF